MTAHTTDLAAVRKMADEIAREGFGTTGQMFRQMADEIDALRDQLQGAVKAERELLKMILDANQGDVERTLPTLAQFAEARLREIGGQ